MLKAIKPSQKAQESTAESLWGLYAHMFVEKGKIFRVPGYTLFFYPKNYRGKTSRGRIKYGFNNLKVSE